MSDSYGFARRLPSRRSEGRSVNTAQPGPLLPALSRGHEQGVSQSQHVLPRLKEVRTPLHAQSVLAGRTRFPRAVGLRALPPSQLVAGGRPQSLLHRPQRHGSLLHHSIHAEKVVEFASKMAVTTRCDGSTEVPAHHLCDALVRGKSQSRPNFRGGDHTKAWTP